MRGLVNALKFLRWLHIIGERGSRSAWHLRHILQNVKLSASNSCRNVYNVWHFYSDNRKIVLQTLLLRQWKSVKEYHQSYACMMVSSNENIFRTTGPLCEEFTGDGEFPAQRPVTQSFNVFFDLRLNKWFSKQSWGWRFEMPSHLLWCHCNGEKNNFNM